MNDRSNIGFKILLGSYLPGTRKKSKISTPEEQPLIAHHMRLKWMIGYKEPS